MQDGNGADERQSTVEPYSEAAWRNEAHESESEPQAEFTKSFDNAYVKSDYTIHDDECSVTQADVESEFDAMMSSGTSLAGAAAVEIPTTVALVSEKLAPEPMADAARAFDAYFDETFEPAGKTAQEPGQPPHSAPQRLRSTELQQIAADHRSVAAGQERRVANRFERHRSIGQYNVQPVHPVEQAHGPRLQRRGQRPQRQCRPRRPDRDRFHVGTAAKP